MLTCTTTPQRRREGQVWWMHLQYKPVPLITSCLNHQKSLMSVKLLAGHSRAENGFAWDFGLLSASKTSMPRKVLFFWGGVFWFFWGGGECQFTFRGAEIFPTKEVPESHHPRGRVLPEALQGNLLFGGALRSLCAVSQRVLSQWGSMRVDLVPVTLGNCWNVIWHQEEHDESNPFRG